MQTNSAKIIPLDMEKWREIVDCWNTSGESQKAYCQRLGISFNTFSYVRSKLILQNKPKVQFAPFTINNKEIEKATSQTAIVLENPDGYKLHISASLSLEQLTKLFKLSGWNNA